MTSLLLIDPDEPFRDRMRQILDRHGFVVTGAAPTLEAACAMVGEGLAADLLLMDFTGEPPAEQRMAIGKMQARRPGMALAILTFDHTRAALLRAIGWRAAGYLSKHMSIETLTRSLHLIAAGREIFPTNLMLSERSADAAARRVVSGPLALSPWELRFLRCLIEGEPLKAMGRELGIGAATINACLKELLRKVRVNNRFEAATWACEQMDRDPPAHARDDGQPIQPTATSGSS
jgi:two-component system, NarL family, nitrate/nitrite response regulator NarL